ncbi:hypothetical protein PIB30_083606 [Stylosanthes scabra]|uniref:Uncharacterized protein n=1 Tax=Stylosanthes scabra TaxID=79078 RepID=A0ABU6WTH9_9FABA|nr:hypothetical protein [Stylosanthes scabra]
MRRRNWAHHVNSFVIEGIKEYQEKGSQAVKGCHFVLQIIYFKERYEGNNLNDPNAPPPWIQRWCGDNLKEKIRAEDEDITVLMNDNHYGIEDKHRRIQDIISKANNKTRRRVCKL